MSSKAGRVRRREELSIYDLRGLIINERNIVDATKGI
jgi:hypothetical protein